MLQLLLGTSGTGKTTHVLQTMKARAQKQEYSLLFVPDQFTSTTETMVYTALGDALSAYVSVYSFTRFAEFCLKTYGGVAVQTLTNAARVVLVRRALEQLQGTLESYGSYRRNIGFCQMCAETITELKIAGARPEFLLETAESMKTDGRKMKELGLIFAAYEALLQNNVLDPVDRLTRAAACLESDFLSEQAVFVDAFDGFTAPQYALLEKLVQAQSCTITFCTDTLSDYDSGMGLFASVKQAAHHVRRIAHAQGVAIAPPITLEQDWRHANAPTLATLSRVLSLEECVEPCEVQGIYFNRARTVYEECKTVASRMAMLAAQGVPYHDMAIIARTLDAYDAPLRYELDLLQIPYFADENTTLEYTAVASFFRAALAMATQGLATEPILRLLKTDLCGVDCADIALLENYTYTWQLKSADWRVPFTRNPAGFGAQMREQDTQELAQVEAIRAQIVPKLELFLQSVRKAQANDISKQLYLLLTAFDAQEHIIQLAQTLQEQGEELQAKAQYRTWNVMMELLSEMDALLAQDTITASEYDEMLLLLLRNTDIGHVPQTQNTVIITTADRMRLHSPRYCFVLGLNAGVFPANVGYSGLLSHSDREHLVEHGLEMPGSYENRMRLEQMFFYRALSAPSQELYLSALSQERGGEVSGKLNVLLQTWEIPTVTLSLAQQAQTPAAALDLLGAQYRDDTPQTAALVAALQDTAMAESVQAMEQATLKRTFNAQDTDGLEQLLGRRMRLSPTRIEQYYRCGFSYFLQSVLRVRPRRKAELSPLESGTLVHYILEQTLCRTQDTFATLPLEQLTALVADITQEYVSTNMPEQGVRFSYMIARIQDGAVQLLCYMQREQAQSGFHPVAFEQTIGFGEDDVSPLTLYTKDGKIVHIVGQIDRVDTMQREEKTYVRVVDYKTGSKTFALDEVYHGFNTQMLFYLFTLCKHMQVHGIEQSAAGVLYLVGDPAPQAMARSSAQQEKQYKVDGVVLYDELVLQGMDAEKTGQYVPVSFTKNGVRISEKLMAAEELDCVRQHIEMLACQMAEHLYEGNIDALPLCVQNTSPCTVCDYRSVCGHIDGTHECTVEAKKDVFRTMAKERQQQGEGV